MPWEKYLKTLGLIDSKKYTKDDLIKESDDILRDIDELIKREIKDNG